MGVIDGLDLEAAAGGGAACEETVLPVPDDDVEAEDDVDSGWTPTRAVAAARADPETSRTCLPLPVANSGVGDAASAAAGFDGGECASSSLSSRNCLARAKAAADG
jgi:hypothetical protein